jgi:cation-transporting ATPase I
MSAIAAEGSLLLHAIPGRMRVRVPGWSGYGKQSIEARLRQVTGVQSAQANGLTGNVLICFDPAATDQQAILAAVRALELDPSTGPQREPPPPAAPASPHILHERHGQTRRARIAMRGLDRDPHLARRVVEYLERRPGVRAHASQLTGRVLVEFDEHQAALEDLIADITGMELPGLPEEDQPAHPLDPAPVIQGVSRAIGATLGLTLLAARRAMGAQQPIMPGTAVIQASAVIGILQGFPVIRNGLRSLLGRNAADLALSAPGILLQTLAGTPVGLALTAAEMARLLTEVFPRRAAWRHYEERVQQAASSKPSATIRLEAGEKPPRTARVLEGTGSAIGQDGLPTPAAPGEMIPAGAQLYGGPFVLELQTGDPFKREPRPAPLPPTLYDRYCRVLEPVSLAYALGTGMMTRSLSRTLAALLLVNPRAAQIGIEEASIGAAARALRGGVTIAGTRPERTIRLPDLLLIDSPRVLTDGFELIGALPLSDTNETAGLLTCAASVAAAAGLPWGYVFPGAGRAQASNGTFDGRTATASIGGVTYTLGPVGAEEALPAAQRLRYRGDYLLLLRSKREPQPLAVFILRPRLARGVVDLVQTCRQHGVEVAILTAGNPMTAQAIARRTEMPLASSGSVLAEIRTRQARGAFVAFASDSASAAEAFDACDLGIALTDGRSHFPARADLLAPDLGAVAAIIEAGARREAAMRDSVGLSMLANAFGAIQGLRRGAAVQNASYAVYAASFAALGAGWLRLSGGERPKSAAARIVFARPERWGRRSVANVLHLLNTTEEGLTSAQAAERHRAAPPLARRQTMLNEILDQLRSPLTGILAAGAGASLLLGAVADIGIIGATIAANIAIGAWQAHKAGQVAEALERMGAPSARALRDGQEATLPASELVPGDILLLASGDRVAADARIISAQGLEVDESALTGESLPVAKVASEGTAASHLILEGSNITSGVGRAVVVAVGQQTLMGTTAAALALEEAKESPLGARLSRLLQQALPVAAIGSGIVIASGFLRTRQLLPQLAIGASIALAAVPEGLPLLASVGEAAVAHRLSGRQALVRRLSAVEALGRVDVACTDKTGTLTEGHLALRLVASMDQEKRVPASRLPADVRHVLLTAGLASPHPDAADAAAHPTDMAVTRGAENAGLSKAMRVKREAESPFDPVRSFHTTLAQGRLSVKGAPEVLAPRCTQVLQRGARQPLDEAGRDTLLATAQRFAGQGLRVLMVAEGTADTPVDDPQGLTALGFVGISDPLRPSVVAAVRRCHDAGVRVIMLTGDHPATARTIASEAGLFQEGDGILNAAELAELQNGELDERLANATVIARATPLDKLRIVESLQRQGHTVAMTGDGVNDAPALRLADVGVAIGRGGTEVARQTADVVLTNDDFSTLVEALVEGRSFWRNTRRALGLLLGENLGEVGMMVGAGIMGLTAPLNARQILAVNLVTDVLPGLAVALQQPERHNLAALAREGTAALDTSLRRDILCRGGATALPSLAAYLLSLGSATLPQARTVAFATVVATQLAQTLDVSLAEGSLTAPVIGAVGGSAGLFAAALAVPPLRSFLNLALPTPLGWALIGAGALIAPALSRALPASAFARPILPHLSAMLPRKLLASSTSILNGPARKR